MSGDGWVSGGLAAGLAAGAAAGAATGSALGALIGLSVRRRRSRHALTLVCLTGPAAGRRVGLNGAALCIGRAPGCDIQLDDVHASRRHAGLIPGASGATLRDLGSSAGVWIDGARVFDAALHPGDQFQIGVHVFALQRRDEAPTAPRRHLPDAALRQLPGDGMADIELGDVLHTGAHFTILRASVATLPAQPLVVKFLNLTGANDARLRARFGRHLRQAMCLDHRHIVAVRGGSAAAQPPFIIEACAAGGSLAARMAGPLDAAEAHQALLELCEALAHVHAQGIAHGGLTPRDVLFGDDHRVWLTNTGLARVHEQDERPERDRMRTDVTAFAEMAQALLGEPLDVRECADATQLLTLWQRRCVTAPREMPASLQAVHAQSSGFRPLRLHVLATRQVVAVTGNPFLLGRALNPADRNLSRLHAELRFEANCWQVAALPGAGADGLRLNGVPVSGARVIAVGDELLLGATALRIME